MNDMVKFLYLFLLVPEKSYIVEKDGNHGPIQIRYRKLEEAVKKNSGWKWSIADRISTDETNGFLKKYLVNK